MASDEHIAPGNPARNLPPVRPPSGRFIAQLFLVPGLIVFFVVLLVLAINYMFVGGQSADQLLIRIDNDNADIRWRGANDLAQVLKRPNSPLRTNVPFALDLCERLEKANKALEAEEKIIGDANKTDTSVVPYRKLEAQRNFVNFLSSSLGEFLFPAGAPELCEMIVKEDGPDPIHRSVRRRTALWALGNLGFNIEQFKKLAPPQQNLIIEQLRAEVNSDSVVRRKAAKNALLYLGQREANDPELIAIDQAIDKASRSDDQYLRKVSGLALNFWNGPLVEETLVRLSKDNGFGKLLTEPEEP